MTANLLQTLAGLAVVLGAIALTAGLARRLGLSNAPDARLLRVVATLPVSARERVVVVEVGAQWLVLGVAPGRVSALSTLPRGELPEAARAPFGHGFDFAAVLRKATRRE